MKTTGDYICKCVCKDVCSFQFTAKLSSDLVTNEMKDVTFCKQHAHESCRFKMIYTFN